MMIQEEGVSFDAPSFSFMMGETLINIPASS